MGGGLLGRDLQPQQRMRVLDAGDRRIGIERQRSVEMSVTVLLTRAMAPELDDGADLVDDFSMVSAERDVGIGMPMAGGAAALAGVRSV